MLWKVNMPMRFDCLVLGAGIVGISTALHLQRRHLSVALLDHQRPVQETSHGNAGIIQREGVVPYAFPRDAVSIFKYALNLSPSVNVHWLALPSLADRLYQYWRNGSQRYIHLTAQANVPLIEGCLKAHEILMQEAGVEGMLRKTGYIAAYRDSSSLRSAIANERRASEKYGVNFEELTAHELQEAEPHLTTRFAGGILMTDPASVDDPGAVGQAYFGLFIDAGGTFSMGDALSLERTTNAWIVKTTEGDISANSCVISLGPWSRELLAKFDIHIPMFAKRGYHMHYDARGNATLHRPVLDAANGFVITAMRQGIRLTTGAEFARSSALPTPVQLRAVEPIARSLFPLAARRDQVVWMGSRPCLPDMIPIMGPVPGQAEMWINTGHHHLGFTLGPISGRMTAELITEGKTFCDPAPYRLERFSV